jgi:hypothetical protein
VVAANAPVTEADDVLTEPLVLVIASTDTVCATPLVSLVRVASSSVASTVAVMFAGIAFTTKLVAGSIPIAGSAQVTRIA